MHFSLLALVSLSSIFSLLGKKIIYIYTIYTTSLPIACFSAHCYMYRHTSDLLHLLPLSLLPLGAPQHCCHACPELSLESKVTPGGCPLACACPQIALVKSTMHGGQQHKGKGKPVAKPTLALKGAHISFDVLYCSELFMVLLLL